MVTGIGVIKASSIKEFDCVESVLSDPAIISAAALCTWSDLSFSTCAGVHLHGMSLLSLVLSQCHLRGSVMAFL